MGDILVLMNMFSKWTGSDKVDDALAIVVNTKPLFNKLQEKVNKLTG